MNNTNIRLIEIDAEIEKAQSRKRIAIFLMIVSIFCLWPLIIVGIMMHSSASNKINALNEEKKMIMLSEYYNNNNNNNGN